jgi:hypothetical protein
MRFEMDKTAVAKDFMEGEVFDATVESETQNEESQKEPSILVLTEKSQLPKPPTIKLTNLLPVVQRDDMLSTFITCKN